MRHYLLGMLVVLGLACELPPDTPVYLSGVALDGRGQPLSLAPVVLSVSAVVDGGRDPNDPDFRWLPNGSLQTQVDGRFSYALTLQDMSLPNQIFRLQLPADTKSTGAAYWVGAAPIELPSAPAWEPATLVQQDSNATHVVMASAPDCHGNAEGYIQGDYTYADTYRYELYLDDQLAWSNWDTQPRVQWGNALFEDASRLRLHLSHFQASLSFAHQLTSVLQDTVNFGVAYEQDEALDVDAGTVPVSRGAACSGMDTPIDPCPFTDGKFAPLELPAPDSGVLLFDLPRPARPRELVFRHASSAARFHVDTSADDGGTWTLLTNHTVQDGGVPPNMDQTFFLRTVDEDAKRGYAFIDVQVSVSAPVTKVRVVFDGTYGTFTFSEISIFE